MRIVVKVGGAVLDDPEPRAAFAQSVRAAVDAGHSVVVVHGGGAQLTRLADALGLETTRVDGLRVTSAAMARAAVQALAGEVNADLVVSLAEAGVRAIGVSGADAGLMRARQRDPRLGFVGDVESVDASVLEGLVEAGFVPTVATLAPSDIGLLNINADAAVAPLAQAFRADAVLFLSDVPHVRGAGGAPLASVDGAVAVRLMLDGIISDGMLPKVQAGLGAAEALGGRAIVRMGSGLQPNPVLALLAGGGTTFLTAAGRAATTGGESALEMHP